LTLRDGTGAPPITRVIRGVVKGNSVYLIPRSDGRVIIGASTEEQGWNTDVTALGAYELLRDASLIVPGLLELNLIETNAGLRPASPDNAPLIGPASVAGLSFAAGHYRNGILLAPLTAIAITDFVLSGTLHHDIQPFTPNRFSKMELPS
jgi:glycine oxidase